MLKKILISCLFCLLGAIPMFALAVSLGNSTVLSNLGEPIVAEIEILQWQDADLTSLEVELASEATFDSFRLEYLPVLSDLSLTIPSPENGELKVVITSQGQMEESFLEVLLLLRWPGGGVSREYILLFDPPTLVVTARPLIPRVVRVLPSMETSEIEANVRPTPEIVRTQLNPRPEPNTFQALRAESSQVIDRDEVLDEAQELGSIPEIEEPEEMLEPSLLEVQVSQIIIERRQYVIQENDSLIDIALQFQLGASNESLYQMLLGIFDLNSSAFNLGNITALQFGQEIVIPGSSDIDNIDPLTAERIYGERLAEGQAILRREEALREEALREETLREEALREEALREEALIEEALIEEALREEALREETLREETLREETLREELEKELLVSNILPANIPPEEARFTPESIEEEPVSEGLNANQTQEATQAGTSTSASRATVLVPSSEVNSITSSEVAASTVIGAADIENLSPLQVLRQNREQQRQQLENRVSELRQQIIEVQTVTLRLSNVVNVEKEKKAEQQKLVNIVASILTMMALLLTIGISIYVLRGSNR